MNHSASKTTAALVLGLGLGMSIWAWAGDGAYSQQEMLSAQTGQESKVREIRDQEITQLRIALGRRTPSNRRADLYFRLAESYLEAYRAEFTLESRVHEKRLETGRTDRYIDRSHSKPYLGLGIKACHELIHTGVSYPKMDQIYYFLGFANGELENRKEAIRHFDHLVKTYPASVYAGEAYRELADAAFDDGSFRKAQEYYSAAAARIKGDSRPRVLHKLAWSYYRTRQYGQAVDTMKQAIAEASRDNEKFLSLREEALRDMAIFMTESGRVDEALAYFQSAAGDKDFFPRVLEKLGKQYERNVEPAKAVAVYEALLKARPNDEAAFRARVKLADLDLRRGKYKEALARVVGKDGAGKVTGFGEPETQTAAQNLRAMIRRTATENHELFRKKGNRGSLQIAEDYYSAYLNAFLTKEDPRGEMPEIEMYLADVKREIGKPQEASELYKKVLDSKDKRYAKEAAALWTASLADAIKKSAATPAATPVVEPPALEREFVAAADDMQEALGDIPEGREAAIKAAQLLAGYKSTQKDAIKRSRAIIAKWPRSPQALTAARLWLQLISDRLPKNPAAADAAKDAAKDSEDDLRDAMKEIRENPVLMGSDKESGGSKISLMLSDFDTRFKVGAIAAQEREKDFLSAGKSYEAFAADAKQRDLAETAYGNAVTSYLKAGDFVAADRVTAVWLKRFKDSKFALESVRSAATTALIRGVFEQAGGLFEKLGMTGGDPDALETAARLFEGNGNTLRARQAWSDFLALYKKAPHHWAVALALARSFESDQKDSEAAKTYKYCLSGAGTSAPDIEAECVARLADLYLRRQDTDQAKALYRKIAAAQDMAVSAKPAKPGKKGGKNKKTKTAVVTSKAANYSPFVGYARYRLAEMMERETKFETLQLPEARLKKALAQRMEFLEPLSRAYGGAVEAGGPWAIAALDRLASWAMNFADDVDNIAPPVGPNIDAAAIAQFRRNLGTVSTPLRGKAIETWKNAYDRAVAGEILSPALPSIADRLADAKVAGLGRAQGVRGKFRLAGISADGGTDGRDEAFTQVRDRLAKNARDSKAWVDYGNLLWGQNKPLLAKIAYERALTLDRRNAAALNNRGVIAGNGTGEEDWLASAEASALFSEALAQDDLFQAAKINRALLLSYYRMFQKATGLWNQIAVKTGDGFTERFDGQAIVRVASGDFAGAEPLFAQARDSGAESGRFAEVYHLAIKQSLAGARGAEKCVSAAQDLEEKKLSGFEKESVERLKRTCTAWKNGT